MKVIASTVNFEGSLQSNGFEPIRAIALQANFDATGTGNTTIYTVPTGKTLFATHVYLHLVTFDGTGQTTNVTLNFGSAASGYTDFASTTPVPTDVNQLFALPPSSPGVAFTATTDFSVNISASSNATTEVYNIYVMGFLV